MNKQSWLFAACLVSSFIVAVTWSVPGGLLLLVLAYLIRADAKRR